MKTILDPSFRYTSSINTDLKKTFARIRRSQQKPPARATAQSAVPVNVSPIVRKVAAART
ncbi:MAG: hypothetical protein IPM30_12270 [Burkholderiales bacterium]|jgi:hypothetical protein|nr:hypothetical protein [Burkholderiales bacterium]